MKFVFFISYASGNRGQRSHTSSSRSREASCGSDIRLTHVREAFVHRGFRATSDDASRMSSMRSGVTHPFRGGTPRSAIERVGPLAGTRGASHVRR